MFAYSANVNIHGSGLQIYEILKKFEGAKDLETALALARKYRSATFQKFIKTALRPPSFWKKAAREHKFECDNAPDHFAVASIHNIISKRILPLVEGHYPNMSDKQVARHMSFLLTSLVYEEAIVFHKMVTGDLVLPKWLTNKQVLNVLGINDTELTDEIEK